MRIDRLRIDGFGRARDVEIDLGPGVTVVAGLNGTGKTTLNAFVRALLFGFPRGYPAIRGGRRGGWLAVELRDGRRVRIERHHERGGRGALCVLDEAGMPLGGDADGELGRILGGANRDVFESIFAFGIDELADAGRLEGGEVSSRIYGASLGASQSILEAARALDEEASDLFRPRGHQQPINVSAAAIAALDAEIASRDVPAEYRQLQERAGRTQERLAALHGELAALEAERAARERLVRADEPWRRLSAVTAELASLGPAPDVADLLPREAALASSVAGAEARAAEAAAELERREAALAPLAEPRRDLLDAAAGLGPLRPAAAAREAEDRALEADRRRYVALGDELAAALADLGPDWDEARLRGAGSFVALRDRLVGRSRDLLGPATAALADSRAALAAATRELALATDEERRIAADLAALPIDPDWTADRLRAAVGAADRAALAYAGAVATRDALAEAAADDAALPGRRGTLTGPAPIAAAAVIAGVAVGILGTAAGGVTAGIVAGIASAVLGAVLAVLVLRRLPAAAIRPPTVRTDRARAAEAALAVVRAPLDVALAGLGLSPGTDSVPPALRERLQSLETAERERAALERQHEVARTQLAIRTRAEAEAAARLGSAEVELAAAQSAWAAALDSERLPVLDAEAVARLLERAEAARTLLRSRDDMAGAVAAAEARRGAWESAARAVLAPLGYRDGPVLALVAAATRDLDEATAAERVRNEAARARDDARRAGDAAQTDLEGTRGAYRSFLAASALADRADLERRHARATRRAALEAERDRARAQIAAIAGADEDPGALEERLEAAAVAAPEVHADGVAEVSAEIADRAAERDGLTSELGGVEQQIRRIEADTDATDLRQRRADALGALEEQLDRYLVARVASALIAAARGRFERLHRPAVVAAAERLFVEWTGGEYAGLVVPFGQSVQGARRADDGSIVASADLSRGTREQLYLAFRLALVEHYAAQAEPLPILMDEILVNVDPIRAERVARSIEDLGTRHQVLYLTCHETVPIRADRTVMLGPNLEPVPAASDGADGTAAAADSGQARRAVTFSRT